MPEESKKTIKFDLSVWYNETTEHIHISGRSEFYRFISTVNNKAESKRCHSHLFNHLKKALIEHNCWPHQCKPLSGRGEPIKYIKNLQFRTVNWGSLEFELPDTIIDEILNSFFVDPQKWYTLGASFDKPISGGLGEYISQNFKQFTPRHASAIAAIMVNEKLLSHMGKKPIKLKKIT